MAPEIFQILVKGTEDKLEKYASRIPADEVLDSNSFVPEIDNALEQL